MIDNTAVSLIAQSGTASGAASEDWVTCQIIRLRYSAKMRAITAPPPWTEFEIDNILIL